MSSLVFCWISAEVCPVTSSPALGKARPADLGEAAAPPCRAGRAAAAASRDPETWHRVSFDRFGGRFGLGQPW